MLTKKTILDKITNFNGQLTGTMAQLAQFESNVTQLKNLQSQLTGRIAELQEILLLLPDETPPQKLRDINSVKEQLLEEQK